MTRLDRSLIAHLPLFAGLEAADLDHILEQARPLRIVKGASVFEQDREATAFFLLLDGRVRVFRTTPDGQQVIVRHIVPGELLGIAQAIGRTSYPATAAAVVDCVALTWPARLWQAFATAYPSFAQNTNKMIGVRIGEAHAQIEEMATQQVERRVAHSLLRLIRQAGKKTEQGFLIDFPLTRQDIAEMTGTTLHTVSRLLSAWEEQGLVVSRRQQVTVVKPHDLLLLAEGRSR